MPENVERWTCRHLEQHKQTKVREISWSSHEAWNKQPWIDAIELIVPSRFATFRTVRPIERNYNTINQPFDSLGCVDSDSWRNTILIPWPFLAFFLESIPESLAKRIIKGIEKESFFDSQFLLSENCKRNQDLWFLILRNQHSTRRRVRSSENNLRV